MGKEIFTEVLQNESGEHLHVILGGKDYYLPFKVLGGKKVAFLDISGQVSLIESSAEELVEKLHDAGVEFDTILNPVSKSNALAHAIAVRWDKKEISQTVCARKSATPGKVSAKYFSVTTPVEQTLSLTDDDVEFIRGKKIIVVDDVYGAGGTTKALMELAEKAGAIVQARVFIGVEGGTVLPDGVIYLFELPTL
jgi:adenine phosphoribosyltransferase